MSLHTIIDPGGLNLMIQRFQTELFNRVAEKLPVGIVHESYGRASRTLKDGKYRVELYNPSVANEYTDILWDDTKDMVSFFTVDGIVRTGARARANAALIVFCNLKNLFPSIANRPDEEMRNIYTNIIGRCLYGFHYVTIETGIDKVLKEYKGSIELMRNVDFGLVHAFRINFNLAYNINFTQTLKLK